jgi:hypothetical protein
VPLCAPNTRCPPANRLLGSNVNGVHDEPGDEPPEGRAESVTVTSDAVTANVINEASRALMSSILDVQRHHPL